MVSLKQLTLQFRILNLLGGKGIIQGIGGDLPKIDMLTHQASQPGVLELFGTPEDRDGIRFFTKRFTVSSDGGMHIKQRTVGIKDTVGKRRRLHGIFQV